VRNCVPYSSVVRTDRVETCSGVLRLVWSHFVCKPEYLALPKDLELIVGVKEAVA
jgi:hypothetical protein